MKVKQIILLVCSFTLYSCSGDTNIVDYYAQQRIKKALPSAQNAIDFIVDKLQYQKIVMIGEHHVTVNEQFFIAENIKKLHDAGFRYLFLEGGANPENALPGSPDYNFYMFYPWMSVGWKYEYILFYQAILEFNKTLPQEDQIRILNAESGSSDYHGDEILNYRDTIAFENIVRIMGSSGEDERAIILYGDHHAVTRTLMDRGYSTGRKYYRYHPLGYRLKQHYGSSFGSYIFYYVPEGFLLDEAKLIPKERFIGPFNGFDGIIVDTMSYGTLYQYNPTNENLKYIFSFVTYYALHWQEEILHIPFYAYYPQSQFTMGLYYLKLYFGDKFNYDFCRVESSREFLSSLDDLKLLIFTDDDPSQRLAVDFEYDKISLYHNYMVNSDIEKANGSFNKAKDVREDYLIKAYELFPDDIWPLYWLGFIAFEKREYDRALSYFQALFSSNPAACLEQLPYAYRMAADCAAKINDDELEREYAYMADALTNEFNIDIYDSFSFHR
jgi:hypothetical protein